MNDRVDALEHRIDRSRANVFVVENDGGADVLPDPRRQIVDAYDGGAGRREPRCEITTDEARDPCNQDAHRSQSFALSTQEAEGPRGASPGSSGVARLQRARF